ncbi:MAG: hypothetical protein WBQ25_07560 [Nitrososphaeraceae archaeon]
MINYLLLFLRNITIAIKDVTISTFDNNNKEIPSGSAIVVASASKATLARAQIAIQFRT